MDAIKFILNEHQKIRKTFRKITKLKAYPTQVKNFNDLAKYLVQHETMEQKVWYPYLKKNANLDSTIKHLVTEEKKAAKEIKKIKKIKNEEKWEDKMLAFKGDVEHHASDEEKKLFPKVRKQIDKADLMVVGKKLQAFRNKYKKKKFKP